MAVQAAFTWTESWEHCNSTAINQMSKCSQPTYHHENHRDLGEQQVQHGNTLGVSRSHSFPVRRPRLGSATVYLTCMSPCTRLSRRIDILRCLRCTRVICMRYVVRGKCSREPDKLRSNRSFAQSLPTLFRPNQQNLTRFHSKAYLLDCGRCKSARVVANSMLGSIQVIPEDV